jgi:hypothetical protein
LRPGHGLLTGGPVVRIPFRIPRSATSSTASSIRRRAASSRSSIP